MLRHAAESWAGVARWDQRGAPQRLPHRVLHKLRHLPYVADKLSIPTLGLTASQPPHLGLLSSFRDPPRPIVAAPTYAPVVPLAFSSSLLVSSATLGPGRGITRRHLCSSRWWRPRAHQRDQHRYEEHQAPRNLPPLHPRTQAPRDHKGGSVTRLQAHWGSDWGIASSEGLGASNTTHTLGCGIHGAWGPWQSDFGARAG